MPRTDRDIVARWGAKSIAALPAPLPLAASVVIYCVGRLVFPPPSTFLGTKIFRFLEDVEGEDAREAEDKVRRALSLIEKYDPKWLRHIKGKLRRIFIAPGHMAPGFLPIVRGCYIPIGQIEEATDPVLAMVLIHEATHARVHDWQRASVLLPRPEIQERLERVCVAREVAFAKKIPEIGEALAKWATDQLETRWWEPEHRAADRQEFLDSL